MKRVRIKVIGKVQGVCFRRYTLEKANELRLTGYVGNRDDGSVEILVQGGDGAVAQLIDWCHHGAPAAEVEQVLVDEDQDNDIYLDFSIIAL
ncbi:acylphosphatase [Shewanella corallii]|uniref:acylphosphatase n=1 Tax=Shewanella corallii TaxID=560080 RepID=A0ABT0N7D3_9GAMM|nr:acylphosphatase [Shewanella corallii]MCL2914343.1 acylphosphatase [Shewanella corallii]